MQWWRLLLIAATCVACDGEDVSPPRVDVGYSGAFISPQAVRADGRRGADLVVRVRDAYGHLFAGAHVVVDSNPAIDIVPREGVTDALGSFVARVPGSTIAQSVRVVVHVDNGILETGITYRELAPRCDQFAFEAVLPLAPAGRQPVLARLDGDGFNDLAIRSDAIEDSLTVVQGHGDGQFGPPATLPAGPYAASVAAEPIAADLDGDGAIDLLTPNAALLGDGNGAFATPAVFGASTTAAALAVGLVDANTSLDAVVAEPGGQIKAHLNNGDGTLQSAVTTTLAFAPAAPRIALGDVSSDGKADLVVIDGETKAAWLLLGTGNGTFATPQQIALPGTPTAVALGDLDADGNLDLALADINPPFTSSVALLRGDGAGAFAAWNELMTFTEGAATQLQLLDLDGDGRRDIVIGTPMQGGGYEVVTFGMKSTISGPFRAQLPSGTGFAVAQLDADSNLDLALGGPGGTAIWRGFNSFQFPHRRPYTTASASSVIGTDSVAYLGDAAVTTLTETNELEIIDNLYNSAPEPHRVSVGVGPRSVAIADFDQDGIGDVVTANANDITISIAVGSFIYAPPAQVFFGQRPVLVATDFDNDLKRDLVVASICRDCDPTVSVSFLRGNGDGSFASPVAIGQFDSSWLRIVAEDFDRDGNQDIAVARYANAGSIVMRGHGDGSFDAPIPIGETGDWIVAGDLNGDGFPDLVANTPTPAPGLPANHRGTLVLLGKGDGSFSGASAVPVAAERSVVIADMNRDGSFDLVGGGDGFVTLALGDGTGGFTLGVRFPTARAGAAYVEAVDSFDSAFYAIVTSEGTALTPTLLCQ